MSALLAIFILLAGVALGFGLAFALKLMKTKTATEIAGEMLKDAEASREKNLERVTEHLKASFGDLSLKALSQSTEEFLKLAHSQLEAQRKAGSGDLEGKKQIIDTQLKSMAEKMEGVSKLVKDLEKDREQKFGELSNQLKSTTFQTQKLIETTQTLKEALASSQVRGQWGERMAEDVLRMAGFIENINYQKQVTLQDTRCRPDFTFFLPRQLTLNMDVKFPFGNYIKFLEVPGEMEKNKAKADFIKDVRLRLKEVTTRDYINPQQNTLDYVLLFIPNEQIYSFIHETDKEILDEALKSKVILCSPVTLFAVLAIIRQSVDNFALEKTSGQILNLLGDFKKQWGEFVGKMDTLGKRILDTQKEFDSLVTTRRRQLEKPLIRMEELRADKLSLGNETAEILKLVEPDPYPSNSTVKPS